ncbi:hypothetical protein BHM03_00007175 [Ensete ventricosum]|nr:hypothetical protein BHM03_00007175 [Ensete ventricosum]
MDEVFNLVLQVVALLGVMVIVMVEATITPSVLLLRSGFPWVGCPEEAFLPDLKEDSGPGTILCGTLLLLVPGASFGEIADCQYDPLSKQHCMKDRLRLPTWPDSPGVPMWSTG